MMKVAVLASLVGSAAAFAPSQQVAHSPTSLFEATTPTDFSNEIGALPPIGFFDPLGLVADGDQEKFDHLRWVELKHGRVSMLAFLGYIITYAGVRFPGAEDIPYGFDAIPAIPGMVWAQMIATLHMMENANADQYVLYQKQEDRKEITPWGSTNADLGLSPAEFQGDFRNGFIDFGWDSFDEVTKIKKRTIELNNGRAAMCGILALMVHEKLGNLDVLLPPPGR